MCQLTNKSSTPSASTFSRNSSRKEKQRSETHYILYCTVLNQVGLATARFGHWSHGGWGYSNWDR